MQPKGRKRSSCPLWWLSSQRTLGSFTRNEWGSRRKKSGIIEVNISHTLHSTANRFFTMCVRWRILCSAHIRWGQKMVYKCFVCVYCNACTAGRKKFNFQKPSANVPSFQSTNRCSLHAILLEDFRCWTFVPARLYIWLHGCQMRPDLKFGF